MKPAAKVYAIFNAADRDAYFRSRKPNGPLPDPKVGEVVCYTRYFLVQIGVSVTDDLCRQEGVITELHANGRWAFVLWNGESESRPVGLQNLARLGANLRRCD